MISGKVPVFSKHPARWANIGSTLTRPPNLSSSFHLLILRITCNRCSTITRSHRRGECLPMCPVICHPHPIDLRNACMNWWHQAWCLGRAYTKCSASPARLPMMTLKEPTGRLWSNVTQTCIKGPRRSAQPCSPCAPTCMLSLFVWDLLSTINPLLFLSAALKVYALVFA